MNDMDHIVIYDEHDRDITTQSLVNIRNTYSKVLLYHITCFYPN